MYHVRMLRGRVFNCRDLTVDTKLKVYTINASSR